MADETETIVVSADVSSLQSQLAIAQAELKAFNSGIKETSDLMSRMGSTASSSLEPHLLEMNTRADSLKAEIDQLSAAIKNFNAVQGSVVVQTPSASFHRMVSDLADVKTSYLSARGSAQAFMEAGVEGAAEGAAATEGLNLATSGAIQEYIRLGHEAMTGNFSRIPGSMVVLASRTGGMTATTLGAIGAWIGLGAAMAAPIALVGLFTIRQHEADLEAQRLAEQFALTGRGATNTQAAIEGEIGALQQMTGVTRAIAQETVAWDAAHADINDKISNAANQLLPQFVSYGKNTVEVLGNIKTSLAEINDAPVQRAVSTFDELNRKFLNLQPSEATAISRMIELGQRTEAVNRIFADLATQGGGSIEKIDRQVEAAKEEVQRAKEGLEALERTASLPGDPESIISIEQAALIARHQVEELEAELKRLQGIQTAGKQVIPIDASQIADQLTRISQDVQKTNAQILQEQVSYLKQEENAQDLSANARHYIETILASKQVELARKTSSDQIETMRATENAIGLIGNARLNKEIADDRALIANKNTSAEDRLRLEAELGAKLSALHTQQARTAQKEDNSSVETALANMRDAASLIIANAQLTEQQKLDAVRKGLADTLTATKMNALQIAQARREEASEETEIHRQTIRQHEQDLKADAQAELSIARSTLDQKKDLLQRGFDDFQITKREQLAAEKQYATEAEQAEEKALQAEGLDAQQIYDKIRVLRAKLNADLAKLDTQMEQDNVRTWQNILGPAQTATTAMFTNLVNRTQTFGQLMRSVLGNMVIEFATARLKIEFDWLAGQTAMALGSQEWATKSLISWIASELGIQTAKEQTAAVSTATDATTAATVASTSYILAAGQIADSAAVAAAAASASTAMIPVVGPELAPAAAAAAYTATIAYEGALAVPALATGTMNVPHDMLAFIHEGESIIPKSFAQGLRETGSITDDHSSRSGDVYLHYNPDITGDRQQTLEELLDAQPYALLDMLSRLHRNGALRQVLG